MAKQPRLFQFLFLSIIVLSAFEPVSAEGITVLSSDQDYDIAKLVTESMEASLVVTQWGELTSEDVQKIDDANPEKLIIIGGPYAVPQRAESLGISSERVGGGDRIETARLALERFFQVNARSYVLPSQELVRDYFLDAKDKNAVFFIGEGSVNERWGRYYATKLGEYFQDFSILTPAEQNTYKASEVQTIIAIGNVDNNHFIAQSWPASLPTELTC